MISATPSQETLFALGLAHSQWAKLSPCMTDTFVVGAATPVGPIMLKMIRQIVLPKQKRSIWAPASARGSNATIFVVGFSRRWLPSRQAQEANQGGCFVKETQKQDNHRE